MASSNRSQADHQPAAEGPSTSLDLYKQTTKESGQKQEPPRVGFIAINADDEVVEISDDDMADSEGGMVINVDDEAAVADYHEDMLVLDGRDVTPDNMIDVETTSAHPSKPVADYDTDSQLPEQGSPDRSITQHSTTKVQGSDPTSTTIKTSLADLSTEELEMQIKYGLFYLDRDQIDLSRPCICLYCLQEGHIAPTCPEKSCTHCGLQGKHSSNMCPQNRRCGVCREPGHNSESCKSELKVTTVPCDLCGFLGHVEISCTYYHFPGSGLKNDKLLKLWISCCVCASKTHLVGDCPHAGQGAAVRWSLKSLDPKQITNLSLASGIRGAEIEAENRGMRPKGLQIRGKAGLHQAGRFMVESSTEEEDDLFLRPPIRGGRPSPRQGPMSRQPNRRPDPTYITNSARQYDRFEAPSNEVGSRQVSRNDWYSTDSFGGRRSRSPDSDSRAPGQRQVRSHQNSWRPGDSYEHRSPSPRGADSYRPSYSHPRGRRTPSPPRYASDSYRPSPRGRATNDSMNARSGKQLAPAKGQAPKGKNDGGGISMQIPKAIVATPIPSPALARQQSNPNFARTSQAQGTSTPQSVATRIGSISLSQAPTRIHSPGTGPDSMKPQVQNQKRDGKGNKRRTSVKDAGPAGKKGKRNKPPAQVSKT